jgi:hypothetical protein
MPQNKLAHLDLLLLSCHLFEEVDFSPHCRQRLRSSGVCGLSPRRARHGELPLLHHLTQSTVAHASVPCSSVSPNGPDWVLVFSAERSRRKLQTKAICIVGEVLESLVAISFCPSSVTFFFVVATEHIIHPILLLKVPFGSHDETR